MKALAIVGTGWISKSLVEAVQQTKTFKVVNVYSRKMETAQAFAQECQIPAYESDFETFCNDQTIEVVYIGTPNATHVQLARQLLEHGKHLIVEKPAFLNPVEWQEIHQLAASKQLFVFEAARHYYEPAFQEIGRMIAENRSDLAGAFLSYAKYSSKYDAFLAGKVASTFSPTYGGGALMDLGVYPLYNAVSWFGMPAAAVYLPQKLANGIDGQGIIQLQYEDFAVTIQVAKTISSQLPQEIYFGKSTLQLNAIQEIERATWYQQDQVVETVHFTKTSNPLASEVIAMQKMLDNGDVQQSAYQKGVTLSWQVANVMWQLRQSASLFFESE